MHRILEAASSPGDLVADFFCGSGAMLSVAEKLNTALQWLWRFGRWRVRTTRKRLLGIKNADLLPCAPGKPERQYWQGVNFNVPCEYVAFGV